MPVHSPDGSNERIPVTEASAEIGTDGRLRVRFRQRPGGRDRGEPPSLAEFVAALAPYRGRRRTTEQHAAVLAALAACGHDVRGPLAQGDGLRSTSHPPRRHFRRAR